MLYPPGTKPPPQDRARRVPCQTRAQTRDATRNREEESGHLSTAICRWGPSRIKPTSLPHWAIALILVFISTNDMSSPPCIKLIPVTHLGNTWPAPYICRGKVHNGTECSYSKWRKDSYLYPFQSDYSLRNPSSLVNMILWKANNMLIQKKNSNATILPAKSSLPTVNRAHLPGITKAGVGCTESQAVHLLKVYEIWMLSLCDIQSPRY